MTITIDTPLSWRDVALVGEGRCWRCRRQHGQRVDNASRIVERIVETGVRAYGINTGVGALSDTVVDLQSQSRLSRNIVLSHACGVGGVLAPREVRAIIAAQIANFAHGHSGVRADILRHLLAFLEHDCIPDVPAKGSAGYLTHNAHTALVLIGEGSAHLAGKAMSGAMRLQHRPVSAGARRKGRLEPSQRHGLRHRPVERRDGAGRASARLGGCRRRTDAGSCRMPDGGIR
jgi:histidine ammonia-lyase